MSELLAPCPDSGPGFYGITVAETDSSPSLSGINKLNFEAANFSVALSSGQTDEVDISFIGASGGGGFYGIIVEESDQTNTLRDDTLRFLAGDFDISNVSNKPQVALATNVARLTNIGPGFYGIIVEESDQTNTLKDDTIRFLATDFDVSNVNSKPQVALATNVARIGNIGPGFYGIIVEESNQSNTQRDDTIRFLAGDFDVSSVNSKPQVALATSVARLNDIGPSFYGIIIEESNQTNTQRDDTIRFLATDFDVSSVSSKPQIALAANVARLSDVGPGFYGITIAETDGTPSFSSIKKINYQTQWFYVEQNSPNTDEVIVNFRGVAAGAGEANTASNLGSGQGVFAQKVGVDLQFKSLTAGSNITLTPSGTEISIASTGGSGGGFYGVNIGSTNVNTPTYKNINTVKFEDSAFYVTVNPINIDEAIVTFRGRPNVSRFTIQGGISGVGGNITSLASYGNNVAIGDPCMAFYGAVTALSLSLSVARTVGTCNARIAKNGIIQSSIDQTVAISAASNNLRNFKKISPIKYKSGDRIGLRTVTSGFTPTGSDATILAYCEENV